MSYDYIILGMGITGLTLLQKLREKGFEHILGLENENEAGGLCRTFYVEGHACDIGGHFFQTKYPEVEDFVFSFFPKEKFYQINPRISKITLDGIDGDTTVYIDGEPYYSQDPGEVPEFRSIPVWAVLLAFAFVFAAAAVMVWFRGRNLDSST